MYKLEKGRTFNCRAQRESCGGRLFHRELYGQDENQFAPLCNRENSLEFTEDLAYCFVERTANELKGTS